MSILGQPERQTQQRVIALFREELGYRDLGDWTDRAANSNIDEGLLTAHLAGGGYDAARIARALDLFRQEADHPGRQRMRFWCAERSPQRRFDVPPITEAAIPASSG